MKICAFSSVCAEDAGWLPQYLREVDRLGVDFAVHLDRCPALAEFLVDHPRCAGLTYSPPGTAEFNETHKQAVMDLVSDPARGYDWALAWDVDETYERAWPAKVAALTEELKDSADYVDVKWLNLWDDSGRVRVDGSFWFGHRVKLYNLRAGRRWKFTHPTTNGAKLRGRDAVLAVRHDLVCLHHGMMTHAMRLYHKERWDRIYTAAVGANPYGFWNHALDESIIPLTAPNVYS